MLIPPDIFSAPYKLSLALFVVMAAAPRSALATIGPVEEATVEIGTTEGEAGSFVSVDVTLMTLNTEVQVAGLQHDIQFDPAAAIAADKDGQPLCEVNADINKPDTAFAFQPPGCFRVDPLHVYRGDCRGRDGCDPTGLRGLDRQRPSWQRSWVFWVPRRRSDCDGSAADADTNRAAAAAANEHPGAQWAEQVMHDCCAGRQPGWVAAACAGGCALLAASADALA